MAELLINIPDNLKKRFEVTVGKGKMGSSIRSFIEAVVGGIETIDEQIVLKKFQMVQDEKNRIDAEYADLKLQIDERSRLRDIAELEKMQKEKDLKEKITELEWNTARAHLNEMLPK